ncbi:MAG: prolyl oligopeptidase family serine peptidase [Planctomycetota bacterium]|nr:prolyl oligopeptidase family serine peptidase [Planctomycetota bacterium]
MKHSPLTQSLNILAALLSVAAHAAADMNISEVLVLTGAGRGGRSPILVDPIAQAIVNGTFTTPTAGDVVLGADGADHIWTLVKSNDNGSFTGNAFSNAWAVATIESPDDHIAVLNAAGHTSVCINGEWRTGDPYSFGFVSLPIALMRGSNTLVFVVGRGTLRASVNDLPTPTTKAWFEPRDVTAPDLMSGRAADAYTSLFALPVVNGTNSWLRGLSIRVVSGAFEITSPIDPIPPLGVFKPTLSLAGLIAPSESSSVAVSLDLLDASGAILGNTSIDLRVVAADAKRKCTYKSNVDASVQYFAVVPPIGWTPETIQPPDHRPGLMMSLHGASVEATNQANCYAPRADIAIVCPTNRRPFGFDWEDWGRIDAIDVLHIGAAMFSTDERKQWLTGHSMGGHGTWIIGAQHPELFASIGPSAGWIDFWSYTGGPLFTTSTDAGAIIARAQNFSKTLLLEKNYTSERVYILHGDVDDNVPVEQARTMRSVLGAFHPDFCYYEQPGASHWWGDQCVDWTPMIDYLVARRLPEPEGITRGSFTTISPAIMCERGGFRLEQQGTNGVPSTITWSIQPATTDHPAVLTITTENVALLSAMLDIDGDDSQLTVVLDGTTIETNEPSGGNSLSFARANSVWTINTPRRNERMAAKNPSRMGPFKAAFDRGCILVAGTHGDDDANAWSLAKARFDSDQFWYRGNGSLRVMTDTDYLASRKSGSAQGHNVILYGTTESNAAWNELLPRSVILATKGRIEIEESGGDEDKSTTIANDRALLLAVMPGPDHPEQSIGVVAPTGAAARRLADRTPYFVAGVHYPDWCVIDANTLTTGSEGFLAAGYFANDWSVGGK